MHTKSILEELIKEDSKLDDDAPWADLRGNPINSRKLASLLKPYGIKSTKVNIDGASLQGYRREDLWDAWQRYLPPVDFGKAEPMEPAEPSRKVEPFSPQLEVPDEVPAVPGRGNSDFGLNTAETLESVPEVLDVPDMQDSETDASDEVRI